MQFTRVYAPMSERTSPTRVGICATPAQTPTFRTVPGARGYAPQASDTTPLPAEVLKALKAITSEMRNIPRDVIIDRQELIHFMNRMARRVDGVAALRVTLTPPRPKHPPQPAAGVPASQVTPTGAERAGSARDGHNGHTPSLSGRALAAVVFSGDLRNEDTSAMGTQIVRTPQRREEPRTITSRKGRAVRVETRSSGAVRQLELGL